ncbi:MAG: metallophosphoesterase [Lachnospiraceae bacterium]|nr:metallophosphoesterase [Lachnospiraceae bacterium]
MIAVYLLPFYLLLNIWILVMFLRWIGITIPPLRSLIFRIPFTIVFLFCTVSMGIAFFLPVGELQKYLKYLGNIWIGVDIFTLLVIVPLGVIRLIAFLVRKRNGHSFKESRKSFRKTILYRFTGLLVTGIVIGSTVYGVYHGRDIQINHYEVDINKDGGSIDSLNAVLIGDIHMGYNVGVNHVQQMVDKINALDPDIILVAGDIFDNEYEALDDPEQLIAILKTMQAKYGVYSVYGNHDIQEKILAGFTFSQEAEKAADERMDAFIEEVGWHHLRDQVEVVADSFTIIGRADEERPGRGIDERADIEELMEEVDQTKPVIVLDHEPKELKEQAMAGVDLCLNGHVHDGQVLPGKYLMKLLWLNSCGYKQIGYMHSIVTSGVGIWGPPMRVGTDSEICQITINFQ